VAGTLNEVHDHNSFDDPIGQIALAVVPGPNRITNETITQKSEGKTIGDDLGADTNQNGVFELTFQVNEKPWPPPPAREVQLHP